MALPIEAGYLSDSLTKVRKYSARYPSDRRGRACRQARGDGDLGSGRSAARAGAELLIAGHRPRWIISAGFAGGLDPALARNDLVLPREVIDLEQNLIEIADDLPHLAGVRPERRPSAHGRSGDLRSAEKAELRRSYGADLVDMETSAVAALARERSLRFLSVRVISDDASHRARPGGGPAAHPLGQLPRRRGDAGDLAPSLGPQGLLDAARAGHGMPPTDWPNA